MTTLKTLIRRLGLSLSALLISGVGLLVPVLRPALAVHVADEKLYVGQKDLDNLAVYDLETLTPTATSPISLGTGAQPQELVADPIRPYLYVSDSALKVVHIINTLFDTLEYSIPLTGAPQGLALSPDGYYLYVATDVRVDKIDTRTRTVTASTASLAPSFIPWDVATAGLGRIFVSQGTVSPVIRAFDATTMAQVDTITPAGAMAAAGIATIANPTSGVVTDPVAHAVRGFDQGGLTTTTWTSSVPFVAGPWAIEPRDSAGGTYFVTESGGPSSSTGDTFLEFTALGHTGSMTRSLSGLGQSPTEDAPQEIAISNSTNRAFVTLKASNKVSVIDLNGANLVETAVLSLAAGANPYGIEVVSTEKQLIRFDGKDRYETATKVSKEVHGDLSVDALAIARGDLFPDGLAAGPLAGLLRGPLLLSKPTSLPQTTIDEIKRVFDGVDDPEIDVWLVGGTSALNAAVEQAIQAIDPKIDTGRASGTTRIETAVDVASKMDTIRGQKPSGVFIAKSTDFPDALTASAISANTSFNPFYMPVLLTETADLNPAVDTYLGSVASSLGVAYLAGGTAALSTEVLSDVQAHVASVTRLGGANRYATAITIAKYFFPGGINQAMFALGTNFPDALVAGPMSGITDLSGKTPSFSMPILLVKSDSVPSETSSYLSSLSMMQRGFIAGGTVAITNATEAALETLY
jgi:putative cell wall-binding protein